MFYQNRFFQWGAVFTITVIFLLLESCGPTGSVNANPSPTTPLLATASNTIPVQPVTISFWEQEVSNYDRYIDQFIADFETANPDVKVERTHYENDIICNKFQAAFQSGSAPDVIRVEITPYCPVEYFAPMDQLFTNQSLSEFFPGSLESYKVKGTLWGIPDNIGNHLMLIYNKRLIAEPPKTFEELIAKAKELTQGDIQGFAYNLNEPFWGAGFYAAFGGWPLDEQDKPQFNNEAFINYLKFVSQLKTDGIVPQVCDYDCADKLMRNGKAAMIINGDWSFPDYTRVLGDKMGVAPVPPINGNNYTEMTAGKYFMVSKMVLDDLPKKEAVQKFVTFMTSAAIQKKWLDQTNTSPFDARLPSNIEVAKDPAITGDPVLAGAMAALMNGRGQPVSPQMTCAWDAWRPALEGVMAGTITPEDAAAAAQKAADDCVSKQK